MPPPTITADNNNNTNSNHRDSDSSSSSSRRRDGSGGSSDSKHHHLTTVNVYDQVRADLSADWTIIYQGADIVGDEMSRNPRIYTVIMSKTLSSILMKCLKPSHLF